jgi:AAA15 family ATPase/GTPase
MLLSFSVTNFKSFKDEAVLDLHAASIDEFKDINTFEDEKEQQVLKGLYVFGPNSAGKSNLLKGIGYMKNIVVSSFEDNNLIERYSANKTMYYIFNKHSKDLPIKFECEFKTTKYYRYSFSIFNSKVYSEKLETKTDRYSLLFERDEKKQIKGNIKFISKISKFIKNVRDNALIVSVLNALNDEDCKDVYDWFKSIIFIDGTNLRYLNLDKLKNNLDFVRCADKTICDVSTKAQNYNDQKMNDIRKTFGGKIPEFLMENLKRKGNYTTHHSYNENKEVDDEVDLSLDKYASRGTINYLSLLSPIFDALKQGSLICIDEIDAGVHVSLVKNLISLFDSIDKNPNNAQIIATTHDVFLLDEDIRRDQIIFVDKNVYGESEVFSLVDLKGVRKRDDFLKKYLLGYYGAIPCLKDLENE